MAIATHTLLSLVQKLAEASGDYISFATTTDLAASKLVVSTTLNQYDNGVPGAFDRWWVYIHGTKSDTGIDTNETLTTTDTGITMDADPSSAIVAGGYIIIDSEVMYVYSSSASGNLVTVKRGARGSNAATHATNTDVYLYNVVERLTGSTTYATSSGTLYVYGANLVAESVSVACELFKYKRDHYKQAILEATKEIYPTLHKKVDDITLVTGNIGPDFHFESWSDSSTLRIWTASNITLLQTSTAGETRGGKYAAHCTATAGNGNLTVHSNTFPELLQLQGLSVDAYVQALPQTADDASIIVTTKQADGTTQTFTSDTVNPAGEFTKLKKEAMNFNDNLAEVEFKVNVLTSGQYVIFDDAYLGGMNLSEYLMPHDLIEGHLSQVIMQRVGRSDEGFYDTAPFIEDNSGMDFSFKERNDGTNVYLKLVGSVPSERRLRLIGDTPLEALSADTDTITLDDHRVPLLIAKARLIFLERERSLISAEDDTRFDREYGRALRAKREKMTLAMSRAVEKIKSPRKY